MARYAIDAPTLLHLVTADAPLSAAHQLVAPNLIRSDAMALLLAAVRRGELSEAEAMARHERLTSVRMRVLHDRVSRRVAWQLAQEHGWDRFHDAEYLAVAKLQADAFVTIDADTAARAAAIVPVEPVDVLFAD